MKNILILILITLSAQSFYAQDSLNINQLFFNLPIDTDVETLIQEISAIESISKDQGFLIQSIDSLQNVIVDCNKYQGKFKNHPLVKCFDDNKIFIWCDRNYPDSTGIYSVELIFNYKSSQEELLISEYKRLKDKLIQQFEPNEEEVKLYTQGSIEVIALNFSIDNSNDIGIYMSYGGCTGPLSLGIGFQSK
jgi:hypothetical protein